MLTALGGGLAAALSFTSADASGTAPQMVLVGGFAGAVTGPPRAIDRDLETGAGRLRMVRCAAGAAAVCWTP